MSIVPGYYGDHDSMSIRLSPPLLAPSFKAIRLTDVTGLAKGWVSGASPMVYRWIAKNALRSVWPMGKLPTG